MADEHLEQMKAFILMTEDFVRSGEEAEPLLEFAPIKPKAEQAERLIEDLRGALFKLRSYQEDADDESYALGVEAGMIKASDILENVLSRFSNGDEIG